MKSKEYVQELFNLNKKQHYVKSGMFLFRRAFEGETILTIVSGKLETMKAAKEDDIVLRNIEIGSSAETYMVDTLSFYKRYDIASVQVVKIDNVEWEVCKAKGEILAFEYKGPSIVFMAPWDEKMLCEEGDFIASPLGGDPTDVYRIEKDTFNKTYKLKQ